MTTIRTALNDAAHQLANFDNAKLECELLLCHLLQKSRTWLHTWPEHELSDDQLVTFHALIERRRQGEPSAYITGEREFWSLPLEVTPDTLIPRPETELLVELTLKHIPTKERRTIVDLGTGSGAIVLALASERPAAQFFAIDASAEALTVAERNRKRHNLINVTLHRGDWFEPVVELVFDVIVSNPPYVREHDPHLDEGDLPFEPRSALVADGDGLNDIRHIVSASGDRLKPDGWLLIEHGYDQADAVVAIFEQYGFCNVTSHRDLAGQPRVVSGQQRNS